MYNLKNYTPGGRGEERGINHLVFNRGKREGLKMDEKVEDEMEEKVKDEMREKVEDG